MYPSFMAVPTRYSRRAADSYQACEQPPDAFIGERAKECRICHGLLLPKKAAAAYAMSAEISLGFNPAATRP